MDTLNRNGIPAVLLKLVFFLLVKGDLGEPCVDTNEFFSGKQEWSQAMRQEGFVAKTFELLDSAEQDMCSPQGFCIAVRNILNTKIAGLNLFAVVCSSWTWMNRGTSQRSQLSPLGNTAHEYVRRANLMTARVILLMRLALACGQACVLENPASSLIEFHPRFQAFLVDYVIYRVKLNLGDFGAPTKKPIMLYCTEAWLHELTKCAKAISSERAVPEVLPTVIAYTDIRSNKRVGIPPNYSQRGCRPS